MVIMTDIYIYWRGGEGSLLLWKYYGLKCVPWTSSNMYIESRVWRLGDFSNIARYRNPIVLFPRIRLGRGVGGWSPTHFRNRPLPPPRARSHNDRPTDWTCPGWGGYGISVRSIVSSPRWGGDRHRYHSKTPACTTSSYARRYISRSLYVSLFSFVTV